MRLDSDVLQRLDGIADELLDLTFRPLDEEWVDAVLARIDALGPIREHLRAAREQG